MDAENHNAPKKDPASGSRNKPTVLAVDDEQVIQDLLKRHLSSRGYEVITAGSGEQAIVYVTTIKPDIVLLDVSMPGLDGIKSLRKLRELHPDLLVVMLTAVNDLQIAQMAVDYGACDYMTKPIDLTALEKVLKTHLIFSA